MASVKDDDALVKAYLAMKKRLDAVDLPTSLINTGHTIFRYINPASPHSLLTKPGKGQCVTRADANKLLAPGDGIKELGNRYSGPPEQTAIYQSWAPKPGSAAVAAGIRPMGGFYCALQQQAIVLEASHHNRRVAPWALTGKCVLRMRVIDQFTVADLSPHNPTSRRLLRELGRGVEDEMKDSKDCSVARGIGLAIAQCGYLSGMTAQTVRESERSEEEKGDNLVLFAPQNVKLAYLEVDKVIYFGKTREPEIFDVA
jgi:hypothetical protein